MPFFSIITVCRNAGGTLRRAMDSLAAQSFADYEWVVVDGASTDDTVKIAREFDPSRLRLVSEPDEGIYNAMNKGVRRASGEFIYFLNADDCFASADVLERVFAAHQTATDGELLYGRVSVTLPDGREIWQWPAPAPEDLLREMFAVGLPHQGCFAHRTLFMEKTGFFREDLRIAGDYDWLLRTILSGRVVMRPLPLVVALFCKGGASSDSARTFEETNRVQDEHPEMFQRLGITTVLQQSRKHTAALRKELESAQAEIARLIEKNEELRLKVEKWKTRAEKTRATPAKAAEKKKPKWYHRLFR